MEEISLRDGEVYGYAVENAALSALKKSGATDEGLELLKPHVIQRLRLRRDGEKKLHVDVLDGNGNPAVGNSPSEPATLEHVITTEFKAKYPSAFAGTKETGSGAPTNRGSGAAGRTLTPEQASQLSMSEYRKARAEGLIGQQ